MDKNKVRGIIVLADVNFDLEKVREKLCADFPSAKIIGGSSYGEMSSVLGWKEDSLIVGLIYGDNFNVETVVVDDVKEGFDGKLANQFNQIQNPKEAKLCLLICDGLSIDGESAINGMKEFIPKEVPIMGGMSADQWTFTGTKQISHEGVYTTGLVAMLLSGDFKVGIGTATGWEPTGKRAVVSRSEGNVVYEIDNMPALDFYEKTLGTKEGTFGEYPLAIFKESKVAYFRAALQWDLENGSMVFAGAVPKGSEVAVSTTTRELIAKATADGTLSSCEDLSGEPSWAMVISCAARRMLLGTQSELEIKNTMEVLGDKPVLGFNCYGEFLYNSPRYPNSPGFLNESYCVVTIGEK